MDDNKLVGGYQLPVRSVKGITFVRDITSLVTVQLIFEKKKEQDFQ